jgi:hypothetical protein
MFSIHITDKYGWLGNPDASKMPVYMYVNYFRMYEPVTKTTSTSDVFNEQNAIANNLATLFPNPANQSITVDFNQCCMESCSIDIYSIDGIRVLAVDHIAENQLKIDISSLPVGLYFLNVKSGDKTQTWKVVRQQ